MIFQVTLDILLEMGLSVFAKRFILMLGIIFIATAILSYCIFNVREAPANIQNVILISIDTCRADFLSCYGFPLETTPNIDAISQEGLLCKQVVSPVPLTLPAHCSMLIGTTPPYHGVLDNAFFTLDKDNITLAEMLKEQGFVTGAFVSSYILDSDFGMDQGFDTYNDDFVDSRNTMGMNERQAGRTTELALSWMEKNQDEKLFLFVHYFDPHFTYNAPEPFDSKFVSANIFRSFNQGNLIAFSSYAGEIAYVDHCIGKIINKLKELGQYDSTLICITSDHGEMLGQHGEQTHGYFIYQGNTFVPLVFKMPCTKKSLKLQSSVGLIDIVPTICSAIGVKIDHEIQGKDLTAYYKNNNPYPDRHLFCMSLEATKYHANPLLGIVDDRYKYIETTRPELYDLPYDPFETDNLVEAQPNIARQMQGKLQQIIEDAKSCKKTGTVRGLDIETLSRLESLGYVGRMVDDNFLIDPEKADPKDFINYRLLDGSIGYLTQIEEYELAEKNCQEMIDQKPDLYMGYYKMAKYLMQRQKYSEAIDYIIKVTELEPDFVEGYIGLAKAYQNLNQFDAAIKYALKALEIERESIGAYYYLSICYYEKEMFDEPQKYLNREMCENPRYFKVVHRLATKLYEKGQIRRAYKKYSKLLEFDPDSFDGLNSMSWLQAASMIDGIRNPQQAVDFALKACEVSEYRKPEAIDTLAVAYAAAGNFQKAIETAQKAIEVVNSQGDDGFAGRIQKRLDLYRQGKTYLDPQLIPSKDHANEE